MKRDNHIRRIFSIAKTATLAVVLASCHIKEDISTDAFNLPSCSLVEFCINTPARTSSLICKNLDIFIYDDDSLMRLDSWQHKDGPFTGKITLEAGSGSGPKIAVALANYPDSLYSLQDISSYEGLMHLSCMLGNENPEAPTMSGVKRFRAIGGMRLEMELKPVMAEIRIGHIKTDFSVYGREISLDSIRTYLLNVNGICPLLPQEGEYVTHELINGGYLDENSVRNMMTPGILCSAYMPETRLFCYPCQSGEHQTSLVVEGIINGIRNYYPIIIGGGIVKRGSRYRYDITITRTGCCDPNTAMQDWMGKVYCYVMDWKECGNETIEY